VEVDEERAGLSRDDVVRVLHAENVLARRYFYPGCHRMEPYRSYYPNAGLLLPETEKLAIRILVLPTGTAGSRADIGTICSILQRAVEHAPEIRAQLRDARR